MRGHFASAASLLSVTFLALSLTACVLLPNDENRFSRVVAGWNLVGLGVADAEKDLKVSGNIKAVAAAIKNNLVKLYGLEKTNNDTLYKVCIGAYRDKNNATNQMKLAKDKGFTDAYII